MIATVTEDGENFQSVPVTKIWGKSGMCPSSNLFSMLFTAMLTDSFSEEDPGIKLRYRTDGNGPFAL
jgi:hypothetical protein